jgi:hypothetical protein
MSAEKLKLLKLLIIMAAVAAAPACGGNDIDKRARDVGLLGAKGTKAATVNRYLWAASLETLDFLPVQTADPVSGLLLTDWYQNPETPNERFKVTVYILDSALRADALRVSIFKQERSVETAPWIDAAVNPATGREIENSILTRARQLRLNQID